MAVCYIVGAGPGNGAAIASVFARNEFKLGLIARSEDTLERLAGTVARESGVVMARGDAGDAPSLVRAFGTLRQRLGPASVLVYNAAGNTIGPPSTIDPERLVDDFRVSVVGALVSVQQVLPDMTSAG